jgi:hypothetical protein
MWKAGETTAFLGDSKLLLHRKCCYIGNYFLHIPAQAGETTAFPPYGAKSLDLALAVSLVRCLNAGALAPRGGVTRQGVVLTDLQSLLDCP